ncbi:MAG: alpha/beta hydrolase [Pseudomonadota bacterium]
MLNFPLRATALCLAWLLAGTALAAPAGVEFADTIGFSYQIKPDITYAVASNVELKLDLYLPRGARKPVPTLVYFHGGGWVEGKKENAALLLMPYLALGWAVVNVEYRLGRVAPAPAAVEDCRCALRWVQKMASHYQFDTSALVVAGDSAGGHLAMTSAMLPAGSPFDRSCPTPDSERWGGAREEPVRVAAVINWFGVADVDALLEGSTARHYAIEWFGSMPERRALAQAISPLRLVRPGLPPLISVHGGADPVVPHAQSAALHAALDKAGVPNRLVTIPGGIHGAFSRREVSAANDAIRAFLVEHKVLRAAD